MERKINLCTIDFILYQNFWTVYSIRWNDKMLILQKPTRRLTVIYKVPSESVARSPPVWSFCPHRAVWIFFDFFVRFTDLYLNVMIRRRRLVDGDIRNGSSEPAHPKRHDQRDRQISHRFHCFQVKQKKQNEIDGKKHIPVPLNSSCRSVSGIKKKKKKKPST